MVEVRSVDGVPAFTPEGADASELQISSVDYDDYEIDTEGGDYPKKTAVVAVLNDLGHEYINEADVWSFSSGVLKNGTSYKTVQYSPYTFEVALSNNIYRRYSVEELVYSNSGPRMAYSSDANSGVPEFYPSPNGLVVYVDYSNYSFVVSTEVSEFQVNFTNGTNHIKLEPVQTQLVNSDGSYEVFENGYHYLFKANNTITIIDAYNNRNHTQWSAEDCQYTEVSALDG